MDRIRAAPGHAAWLAVTVPISRSECPPIYLVAACTRHVHAQRERLQVKRRGPRVVDHADCAAPARDGGQQRHVLPSNVSEPGDSRNSTASWHETAARVPRRCTAHRSWLRRRSAPACAGKKRRVGEYTESGTRTWSPCRTYARIANRAGREPRRQRPAPVAAFEVGQTHRRTRGGSVCRKFRTRPASNRRRRRGAAPACACRPRSDAARWSRAPAAS